MMVLNKMENEHCAKDGNGVVQEGFNELNENTKMVHSFFLQQNVVFFASMALCMVGHCDKLFIRFGSFFFIF